MYCIIIIKMIKLFKKWKLVKQYNNLDIKNIKHCEAIVIDLIWEIEHKQMADSNILHTARKYWYHLSSY